MEATDSPYSIILFDGVCNLCNSSVTFIMDRDRHMHFRFAPLESDIGSDLTAQAGIDRQQIDSIVLIEGERSYIRSTAALRIARRLDGLWPLLYGLIVIPPFVRDAVYDAIAANRYRWFGRRETCRVPTPEDRRHFLAFSLPSAAGPSE